MHFMLYGGDLADDGGYATKANKLLFEQTANIVDEVGSRCTFVVSANSAHFINVVVHAAEISRWIVIAALDQSRTCPMTTRKPKSFGTERPKWCACCFSDKTRRLVIPHSDLKLNSSEEDDPPPGTGQRNEEEQETGNQAERYVKHRWGQILITIDSVRTRCVFSRASYVDKSPREVQT